MPCKEKDVIPLRNTMEIRNSTRAIPYNSRPQHYVFFECGENWACNRDLLIVLVPWMDIVGMQILAHYKLACVANAYKYDIIIGKLNNAMCL